eukprot:m.42286 g.42286  ORF g.42286 m.42286 type:complete len:59 (-) comp8303_c0_seq1:28-204(-)
MTRILDLNQAHFLRGALYTSGQHFAAIRFVDSSARAGSAIIETVLDVGLFYLSAIYTL